MSYSQTNLPWPEVTTKEHCEWVTDAVTNPPFRSQSKSPQALRAPSLSPENVFALPIAYAFRNQLKKHMYFNFVGSVWATGIYLKQCSMKSMTYIKTTGNVGFLWFFTPRV
jgi:hypothetical protein